MSDAGIVGFVGLGIMGLGCVARGATGMRGYAKAAGVGTLPSTHGGTGRYASTLTLTTPSINHSMAKNLLTKRKHHLVVWNRDGSKAEALAAEFPGRVTVAATAREVVSTAQVTFSMLSTLEASEAVFAGADGVLAGVEAGTAIVDCATLTPERMVSWLIWLVVGSYWLLRSGM